MLYEVITDQTLARRGGLRLLLAQLTIADSRSEHAERLLAVLVLRARVLALDHDVGWQMRYADRRITSYNVCYTKLLRRTRAITPRLRKSGKAFERAN